MTHLDPDEIALLALGEVPTDDDRTHLDECPECAQQLVELGHVAEIGRETRAVALETPPDAVWDRIRDELGLDEHAARPTASGLEGRGPRPTAPQTAPASVVPASVPVHRPARRRRRGSRAAITVLAAFSALIVGVAGGAWWQSSRGDRPAVVARADLAAFPDWAGATGTAELEDADGGRELVVHLDATRAEGGYREVWLIAADASGLVPLGALNGTDGRFSVPADIDLADYPLVDISEEPLDGDPAHSGDSIVRGPLRND